MTFIEIDELIELGERLLRSYDQQFAFLDRGKLESALGAVQASFGGEYLLKTVEQVAAGYWYYICQAHALVDGNKRTALTAVELFLHNNGYELDHTNDEAEAITLGVASGDIRTREELESTIRIKLRSF